MFKRLNYYRAIDILSTANPNFNLYYTFDVDYIYFWISDKPYYCYVFKTELKELEKEVVSFLKEKGIFLKKIN